MNRLAAYWKTWLALLTPVFIAIQTAVTDDKITSDEWQLIVGAFIGVLFVLFGPSNKDSRYR